MGYFLKKTKNKKGVYLQIYESFYDPTRKQTAHRSVRPVGYVHELKAGGIDDPVAHFKREVDAMNERRLENESRARVREIGEEGAERMLGYFPLKGVNSLLGVERDFGYLQLHSGFRFSLYEMTSSLVYARACAPCSKSKTFHEVLPQLMEETGFTRDQMYEGLAFLGEEYEKVAEIYNAHVAELWPRDTASTYFDCTNFYFEIDREDGLRRKGPSKEHRPEPIVGLGLLLDAECVPIGMTVFPGNESEQPKLRELIADVKARGGISGRTVRVADKGLNSTANVSDALLCGDGYIFSRSLKKLEAKELAWALADDGWVDVLDGEGEVAYRLKEGVGEFGYNVASEGGGKRHVELPEKRIVTFNPTLARKQLHEINRQVEKARSLKASAAKRSEFGDCAKYVTFAAVDGNGEVTGERVAVSLNHKAIERARLLAGYNMIVTSETGMAAADIYSTYHNLWRIEESFKIMKSQLDARPVYLQKPETITGHFLICYIAVLLLRLLQLKVLGGRWSSEDVMGFARGFRCAQVSERKYVNTSRKTPFLVALQEETGLPLKKFNLGKRDVDAIMGWKPERHS